MAEWPKATEPWLRRLMEKRQQATAPADHYEAVSTGARAVVAAEALICRKLLYTQRVRFFTDFIWPEKPSAKKNRLLLLKDTLT